MSIRTLKNCGMAALLVLFVVGLSGCASTVMTAPPSGVGGSFTLDGAGTYEIGATVEATETVTTIMGIYRMPSDNKAGYVGGAGPAAGGPLAMILGPPKDAKARATYFALQKAGDADTIIPLSTTVVTSGFGFIYKVETATVRGKAVKIK